MPLSREADAARQRLRRGAVKPTHCGSCLTALVQPRTSVRRYCSTTCRSAAFYAVHPGYGYVAATPVEPMPMPYVGHPIFEQAARAANLTSTAFSVDWGQNDILGEAVLAIIEGRDPEQAVRKWRSAEAGSDRRRAWGVTDMTSDEAGNIYAARDFDD